jgi:hypothetical protein
MNCREPSHRIFYPKPRGFSKAESYLAYKQAMQKFMEAYNEVRQGGFDALALDYFFLHRAGHVEAKRNKQKSG